MNSFSIIISILLECVYTYEGEYIIKTNNPVTAYVSESFISDKKFHAFDNNILNPFFITGNIKERHMNCFFKAQKVYHILCRFVRRYKVSRSIKFDSAIDLCLNDISSISEMSIIKLYVDTTRVLYTFRISDLIQVINAALTYNSGFFAEPQTIKNPYTNIPFTKSELYNIYYSIKYSHFEMPYLFQQYLKQDFSLIKFTYLHEPMLREIAIDDFCKSATDRQKYNQLIKMLVENSNIFDPSNIDPDFPKVKVVAAFSYLLRDYVTFSFTLISVLRKASKQKIKRELAEFKRFNPLYGRKLLVRKYKFDIGEPFIFGDKTRTYTIEHKFIDTVVTRPPIKLKKQRRARGTPTRNRRPAREQANTGSVIRSTVPRGNQRASSIQLDWLISSPLIRESENIIIDDANINTPDNSFNTYMTFENTSEQDETDSDDDENYSDDDQPIAVFHNDSSSDEFST
jgi:hypothetical protein